MGVVFPFTLMRKGSKESRYQMHESLPHTWLPRVLSVFFVEGGGCFYLVWFSVWQRASREQCVLKKKKTRISACKEKQKSPGLVT